MDEEVEVTITPGDPRFFQALQNPEGLYPFLSDAMDAVLQVYGEVASEYAPESEANKPGRTHIVQRATKWAVESREEPMSYYERGRGTWYPLKTHKALQGELPLLKPHTKAPKTLGSMRTAAQGFQGVTGYRLRPTSQQMHDRWTKEVHQTVDGVIGNLRNLATYSSYVQGQDQTLLHQQRGWKTAKANWEDPKVQEAVQASTTKALDDYYGE